MKTSGAGASQREKRSGRKAPRLTGGLQEQQEIFRSWGRRSGVYVGCVCVCEREIEHCCLASEGQGQEFSVRGWEKAALGEVLAL